MGNRDHFVDYTIGDGPYDIEYIEAVLCEDQEEIDRIEYAAQKLGFGPRVECTNISNFSTSECIVVSSILIILGCWIQFLTI